MTSSRKRTRRNTEPFSDALARVQEYGTLTGLQRHDEGFWTFTSAPYGAEAAAVELMEKVGGFMVSAGGGLSLVEGRAGTTNTLLPHDRLKGVLEARDTYREITGEEPKAYSIAGIARDLLEWAAPPEEWAMSDCELLPPGLWHHQECLAPGEYDDVTLWDVSGYYWNLLRELRNPQTGNLTPRLRYVSGRLLWFDLKGEAAERWVRLVEGVAWNKPLRNALVGCMTGKVADKREGAKREPPRCYSSKGGTVPVYHYPMHSEPGPFHSAGLLITATGLELTYRQCLTDNAIYGNIDCVVLPTGQPLTPIWTRYGLPVGEKAQGSGEVCHVGSWRIGGKATGPYNRQEREHKSSPRGQVPPRRAQLWLHPKV